MTKVGGKVWRDDSFMRDLFERDKRGKIRVAGRDWSCVGSNTIGGLVSTTYIRGLYEWLDQFAFRVGFPSTGLSCR